MFICTEDIQEQERWEEECRHVEHAHVCMCAGRACTCVHVCRESMCMCACVQGGHVQVCREGMCMCVGEKQNQCYNELVSV